MGKVCYGLHACEQFVAIAVLSCALPFRIPVAGVCHPVGSDAQASWGTAWVERARLSEAHGVKMVEQCVSISHFAEYVACAVIGCEIVVEAVPPCLADACLLSSASPVNDVVSAPESGVRTEVIGVDL